MLYLSVNRISLDCSFAVSPVAAAATAMVCKLIILSITPPAELAATLQKGYEGKSYQERLQSRVGSQASDGIPNNFEFT